MSTRLRDLPAARASEFVMHPIHQDNFPTLVRLIVDLRQCRTYANYYQFQEGLLSKVLAVQTHGGACNRVAKRLRRSKTVPADAPELHFGDVNDLEAWELEASVCERVERQLCSIGDAMAWRLFNHDRRVILALARNQSSGPVAGKAGFAAERRFAAQFAQDDDKFALLHEVTTCLRIGDATLFVGARHDYEAFLCEIKTNPDKRKPAQLRRKKLAEEAIRDGGPLPEDRTARLVSLGITYKTHLDMLRDAFARAESGGLQDMKVPGGRALVAVDVRRGYELWPEPEFLERTDIAHRRVLRRAGIESAGNQVTYMSDDRAARSPVAPPWAIYPLPALTCANLIADAAVYLVTLASEPVLSALDDAGIRAEWLLPNRPGELKRGHIVLNAHYGGRTVQMRESELQRLQLELVDLPTWVEGVKALLARDDVPGHPWPHFADEWKVWV